MTPLTPADYPALAAHLDGLAAMQEARARQDGLLSERDRAGRMAPAQETRAWAARVRAAIPTPAAGTAESTPVQ